MNRVRRFPGRFMEYEMKEPHDHFAEIREPKARLLEIREGLECIRSEISGLECVIEEFRARVEPLRRPTPPVPNAAAKLARIIGTTLGSELLDIEERINRLYERLAVDLELMEF